MAILLWGSETLVNTEAVGPQTEASITGLTGGGFVVCWMTGSGSTLTVKYQVFNPDGTANGPERDIAANLFGSSGRSLPSVAALPNGGFVIAFDSANSLSGARIFDADGSPGTTYLMGEIGDCLLPRRLARHRRQQLRHRRRL